MKKYLLFSALICVSFFSWAQAFKPDNLVLYQYGDGVNNLPANTTSIVVPTFLIEYDLNGGGIVQTKALPTAANVIPGGRILSGGVKFVGEGLITLSPNGHFLTLIGHNRTPDGTTTFSGTTQRTIGIVTADGAINTGTGAKANTFAPFCAVTDNGRNIWQTSNGSGLKYKTENSPNTLDTTLLSAPANYSSVYIFNDELYFTSPESPRIGKLVNGLPYKSNQTYSTLPGYPDAGSPTQLIFLDYDTSNPQPDLLYVTDYATNSLQKWVFDGTNWITKGSVNISGLSGIADYQLTGITGKIINGNVLLYCITPSSLLKFTDNNAISTTVSVASNSPVIIKSAISGKSSFAGIAFTPGTGVVDVSSNTDANDFATKMQSAGLINSIISNVTTSAYPGIQETQLQYTNSAGNPTAAFFLKVDLSNPNNSLKYITPENRNTNGGTLATVSAMIASKNSTSTSQTVIGAINGNYFTGGTTSLGLVVKDGNFLKDATDGGFYPNLIISQNSKAYVGDQFNYRALSDSIVQGIGARYFLMKKGKITGDSYIEAQDGTLEPRTSVGLLSPTKLVFIVIDGRRTGWSGGSSILNLAKIYKAIGATDALNLDGGGSSVLLYREPSGIYSVRNKPSDATGERAVADGLAIMVNNSVLPIKLTSFKAVPSGNYVNVNWVTENEENNNFFTIERTLDGHNYEIVGKVNSVGNTKTSVNYDFVDDNPFGGTSYYRLKQTDFDGKYIYSELVTVKRLSGANSALNIYPNPVNNQIIVKCDGLKEESNVSFTAFNSTGQLIINGNGRLETLNQSLNKLLPALKPGVYYISVKGNIKNYTGQFIKN
ncbi:hypothetical protein A5893_16155 [Pedobacter psychrophilus]|uniref:Secretion system C-terminal sorting domain-containing protein n=1 Tax=Pedobacter psychrophilus TaxID=1826909 RepID=A0A179DCR2_9SPHI|nr:phosphodiester glycosidase family protein [Pedobacter psychrophilus]OAQ38319.1 hypothetical protein A5893_16155 [Pedobacter psychrophilus]